MSTESVKPPTSFLWTAGAALVWNLMGFLAYYAQVTMTPDTLAQMPDAERTMYESIPAWANGTFAIAVTAGVVGCLLLILRHALALPALIVSLLAVLIQNFNSFVLMDALSIVGAGGAAASGAIILVGAYLVWLANDAKQKGWLS